MHKHSVESWPRGVIAALAFPCMFLVLGVTTTAAPGMLGDTLLPNVLISLLFSFVVYVLAHIVDRNAIEGVSDERQVTSYLITAALTLAVLSGMRYWSQSWGLKTAIAVTGMLAYLALLLSIDLRNHRTSMQEMAR